MCVCGAVFLCSTDAGILYSVRWQGYPALIQCLLFTHWTPSCLGHWHGVLRPRSR